MRRYLFSRLAKQDLHEIRAFLKRDSPAAARRTVAALHNRCGDLAETPGMGRNRPDLGEEVYCFTVAPYLILYSKGAKGIEVIRILHSARDIESEFQ